MNLWYADNKKNIFFSHTLTLARTQTHLCFYKHTKSQTFHQKLRFIFYSHSQRQREIEMWQTLHFRLRPLKYDDEYRKWNNYRCEQRTIKSAFIKFILRVLRTITFILLLLPPLPPPSLPLTNTSAHINTFNICMLVYIKFHHKHRLDFGWFVHKNVDWQLSAHLNNKSMAQNDPIKEEEKKINGINTFFSTIHSLCLSASLSSI